MAKMIAVQLEKLFEDTPSPFIATQASACFDLCAHRIVSIDKASKEGPASMLIGTGWKFAFDADNEMKIFSRSGHGFKHGIRLANSTGIIDADYQDEVMIKLVRDNNDKASVQAWDELVDKIQNKKFPRVAQAQMNEVIRPMFMMKQEQQEQPQHEAPVRTGGFGSTGDDLPPAEKGKAEKALAQMPKKEAEVAAD